MCHVGAFSKYPQQIQEGFRVKAAPGFLCSVCLYTLYKSILFSLPPAPSPSPPSVVSQKFQQSGSRVRNPNYGRSPRLAGASHSPQAAPTSPHLAPFTSLTHPKTLPHSPTSPRPGLLPESGQNWENYLLLVYRGRGMPGMGQRISAMPRILRMRVSSRAGPLGRGGGTAASAGLARLPCSTSHAILLSLRPRVTRDHTPIFSHT